MLFSLDDVYDARRVAEQIGIPYYVVNFRGAQFEEHVIAPFVYRVPGGAYPHNRARSATTSLNSTQFLEMATPWAPCRSPRATTHASPRDAGNGRFQGFAQVRRPE